MSYYEAIESDLAAYLVLCVLSGLFVFMPKDIDYMNDIDPDDPDQHSL